MKFVMSPPKQGVYAACKPVAAGTDKPGGTLIFNAGPVRYFIDGKEVSREEAIREERKRQDRIEAGRC